MKFDKLVKSILNEEWMDDRMSLNIKDMYRGGLTNVGKLVGDEKNSETIEGINGDGSDEFKFPGVSFDAAVKYGTEIGLWKEDGEGNLVVIDGDKWDEFYSETVSASGEEEHLDEAGIIDKIRSKNYDRLAQRSYKKATKAWDKASEYEWDDAKRDPHEKEFMKQMDKMSQREKRAKSLNK